MKLPGITLDRRVCRDLCLQAFFKNKCKCVNGRIGKERCKRKPNFMCKTEYSRQLTAYIQHCVNVGKVHHRNREFQFI